jgi:hypothetical protein
MGEAPWNRDGLKHRDGSICKARCPLWMDEEAMELKMDGS